MVDKKKQAFWGKPNHFDSSVEGNKQTPRLDQQEQTVHFVGAFQPRLYSIVTKFTFIHPLT